MKITINPITKRATIELEVGESMDLILGLGHQMVQVEQTVDETSIICSDGAVCFSAWKESKTVGNSWARLLPETNDRAELETESNLD